jgi:hypothetical protein
MCAISISPFEEKKCHWIVLTLAYSRDIGGLVLYIKEARV